jgi:hypothetical protein
LLKSEPNYPPWTIRRAWWPIYIGKRGAGVNLGDRMPTTTSALYACCCVAVIAPTAVKRHRSGASRERA